MEEWKDLNEAKEGKKIAPKTWRSLQSWRYSDSDDIPKIVLLPGASTPNGEWAVSLANSKRATDVVRPIPIGESYIPLSTVLFGHKRSEYIHKLSVDLEKVKAEYGIKSVSIVAHSYATRMIFDLLDIDNRKIFDKIFLIGSVARTKSIKKHEINFNRLYCDCVSGDFVSHFLQIIFRFRYESSSVNGIRSSKCTSLRWDGGHSTLTSEEHFFDRVVPRLLGEEIQDKHSKPRWLFGQHSIWIYQWFLLYPAIVTLLIFFVL